MASDDGNGPGGEPHRFQDWAEDMIKYLAEDIRETKKLTKETRTLAVEAKRTADAAWQQVEQFRELVVITRNESQIRLERLERPDGRPLPWKKLFGIR